MQEVRRSENRFPRPLPPKLGEKGPRKNIFVVFLPVKPAKKPHLNFFSLPSRAIYYPQVCRRTTFVPKKLAINFCHSAHPPAPRRPSPLRYRASKRRGGGNPFFAGFERLCRSKPALIRSPFPRGGKGPGDRGSFALVNHAKSLLTHRAGQRKLWPALCLYNIPLNARATWHSAG
jgi:hypothetical protein